MPVGAQGANFKLYEKQEVTEAVLPTGAWNQRPCFSFNLGATQEMQQDVLLSASNSRDASDPFYNLIRVAGDAMVPVDSVHFPAWLKKLLGAPTTTGTTNFTHVFKSGSAALPSTAFEKAFPDKSRFHQNLGVYANTLALSIDPEGAAQATIGLIGLSETRGSATAAGTPVVSQFTRFHKPQGSIARAGAPLSAVTGGNIDFSNGMEAVATVRSDMRMEGVDIGQSTAGGQVSVRYDNDTLHTDAVNGAAVSLTYALTISATLSIEFLFPRTFLQRAPIQVSGPTGLTAQHAWRAAWDSVLGCLMQVTVKNQTATY
jgi:hypothetical protein